MAITLNGTTGITTPDITSTAGFDSADLTGDIAAARITDALNATGSAPIYACRAWVNFNGTGTVAIRASGNVTSITDNGAGNYTVNFTTAMPDANYAATFGGRFGASYRGFGSIQTQATGSLGVYCHALIQSGSLFYPYLNALNDHDIVTIAIFR